MTTEAAATRALGWRTRSYLRALVRAHGRVLSLSVTSVGGARDRWSVLATELPTHDDDPRNLHDPVELGPVAGVAAALEVGDAYSRAWRLERRPAVARGDASGFTRIQAVGTRIIVACPGKTKAEAAGAFADVMACAPRSAGGANASFAARAFALIGSHGYAWVEARRRETRASARATRGGPS
jgi:hypothetical protein